MMAETNRKELKRDVHDRKRGDNQFSKRRFNLRTLHEPLLLKKDHKIQG